ncbi:MAG: nuclear transport factor 2 family protein [Planctomycetota bacterium]
MSTHVKDSAQVVKDLYASFAKQDIERARSLLSDDVQWLQCDGFPDGGQHHGIDNVIEKVFRGLHDGWQDFTANISQIIDAGDHVIVLGKYTGTHSVTGKSMKSVFANVFDIRNGKVTRFRQYADTAPMVLAMRLDDI